MKISDLSSRQLADSISGHGLPIKIGPFWLSLRSQIPNVIRHISIFYREYPTDISERFFDFHISLNRPKGIRRWVRPQVIFSLDEFSPFKPLPYEQAFAMFEWGLNWCIATTAHHYLIIHAAVLEKGGRAVVMPGMPGSGKSTLCAALSLRGWRLLSDEMALVNPETLEITPIPRPVSLKNESIEVIRRFDQESEIGPAALDTAKGTVAHLYPGDDGIKRSEEECLLAAIVFPKYGRGCGLRVLPKNRNKALLDIQENSFNSNVLGEIGFDSARRIVNQYPVYSLEYSDLESAMSMMSDVMSDKKVLV